MSIVHPLKYSFTLKKKGSPSKDSPEHTFKEKTKNSPRSPAEVEVPRLSNLFFLQRYEPVYLLQRRLLPEKFAGTHLPKRKHKIRRGLQPKLKSPGYLIHFFLKKQDPVYLFQEDFPQKIRQDSLSKRK